MILSNGNNKRDGENRKKSAATREREFSLKVWTSHETIA